MSPADFDALIDLVSEGVPLAELAEYLPDDVLAWLDAEVRAGDLIDRCYPDWLESGDDREDWQCMAAILTGLNPDPVSGGRAGAGKDFYNATHQDVAHALGVTREAIRVTEAKALRKLRDRFPHLADIAEDDRPEFIDHSQRLSLIKWGQI